MNWKEKSDWRGQKYNLNILLWTSRLKFTKGSVNICHQTKKNSRWWKMGWTQGLDKDFRCTNSLDEYKNYNIGTYNLSICRPFFTNSPLLDRSPSILIGLILAKFDWRCFRFRDLSSVISFSRYRWNRPLKMILNFWPWCQLLPFQIRLNISNLHIWSCIWAPPIGINIISNDV